MTNRSAWMIFFGIMMASCFPITARCQSETSESATQSPTELALKYAGKNAKPKTLHPDFILPLIDGAETLQLSQYRGQKVLLLHFASW